MGAAEELKRTKAYIEDKLKKINDELESGRTSVKSAEGTKKGVTVTGSIEQVKALIELNESVSKLVDGL